MTINNSFRTLEVVITAVRKCELGIYDVDDNVKPSGEWFNIYSKNGDKVKLEDIVFIGEPVEDYDLLESGEFDYDTLPEQIKGKDWSLLYSGEIVESVISSMRYQRAGLDHGLIIQAIDYYCEYDCFYDFTDNGSNAGELET